MNHLFTNQRYYKNILIVLETDMVGKYAYWWASWVMKLKYDYEFNLSISSKWGIDLYHYMVYLDSLIEYNKDLFRSVKYLRHGDPDDTYYDIIQHFHQDAKEGGFDELKNLNLNIKDYCKKL
jgi:hypothetical protein|tara:strand:- start:147 stop:512 length:366 start_codon:yes stop_codon:yes gene_type:complete